MAREDMAAEERLRSKSLYRIELYLIKIIPYIMALIYLLTTVLSYFYIDVPFLSYLGSCSILTLLFLYTSSFVFRFCVYHRLAIHYITINWLLNIYDYYIGIPLNDKDLFLLYMMICGIIVCLIVALKYKNEKSKKAIKQSA